MLVQFSLVDSIFRHCHSICALSPVFVNCDSNSSVTVAEARDSKSNFGLLHWFRQSFNKNRLPDEKAQQHLTNLNDKIINLFWKNVEFDPCIPNLLSDIDEFQSQLTNLNAEFKSDWQKTNLNDNLTILNLSFERSKLLRTKLNWKLVNLNEEVTKMGGKTYIS